MKKKKLGNEKLVPVVVQDIAPGRADAGLRRCRRVETRTTKKAWFFSRSRKALWMKGETSGNTMAVRRIRWDCDRDTALYEVEPKGPACHTGTQTCFGPRRFGLGQLEKIISAKKGAKNSYTATLFDKPWLLAEKLCEEGAELAETRTKKQVIWEAADVLYFTLVKLAERGVTLDDVVEELARRNV